MASNEKTVAKIKAMGEKQFSGVFAKFFTKKNIAALAKYCQSNDADLRAAAAMELSGIREDEAYNELVLLIRDPELSVRKAAVTALGVMGRKSAADHVRHVMKSETDADTIKACQDALAKLL